jgi:hypothetical protein
MKHIRALTLYLAALLLAGCSLNKSMLVLDPVGPPPAAVGQTNLPGTLIVYSAFSPHGSPGIDRPVYTSYQLLQEGQPPRRMKNDPMNALGGPLPATLQPGTYTVVAKANGFGKVKVPVTIRGGQTTVVHLEQGGSWPNREEIIKTGASCLPDGRVVGWRAQP